MSTCHETLDSKTASSGAVTIALAGNPNSGKTTIFNALTGLRQKVANYPGVTVEKKTGRCRLDDGSKINIIDLPGTYSLISRSPDEVVAMEVLRGLRKGTPAPDAVIVVVDASNLQRNLYLVSQLIEMGRPMVIALNMMDIARRRGINVSAERLENVLGVPVVEVVGNKHQGITPLKEAIRKARVAKMPEWPLPEAMKLEVSRLAEFLSPSPGTPGEGWGECDFECKTILDYRSHPHPSPLPGYRERGQMPLIAERLLIGDLATDLAEIVGNPPVRGYLTEANNRLKELGIDPMQADIEAHYEWIDQVAAAALVPACETIGELSKGASLAPILNYAPKPHFSERLDRILIHKFWGLLIFAAVMATLFISIFWLAQPIMDAMQKGITALGHVSTKHLGEGPLKDLINDGIFAGVGTVLVFLPQIALLFFFLAILEDSGYLARAAFLMDRLLSKVGLHGKSFIPLLSSFACAIPGIMATRTIENRKDRLATILVAPFMSCSARLPVYTLLIGTFFVVPGFKGTLLKAGIMLACYVLGILAAVITAIFFKRSFLKGMPSSFILEMPTYKMPQLTIVARQVWSNASQFVKKAGTTIFALSVILWALAYYPRLPETQKKQIQEQYGASANTLGLMKSVADHAKAGGGLADLNLKYSGTIDLNNPGGTAAIVSGLGMFSGTSDASTQPSPQLEIAPVHLSLDLTVKSVPFTPLATTTNPLVGATNLNNLPPATANEGKFDLSKLDLSVNGKAVSTDEIKKDADEQIQHVVDAAQSEYSFAGRFGHKLEPVIRPLGYDWKMGVGLVAAFAAREVFVSTEGIVYATGGDTDSGTTNLQTAMQNARQSDGKPVWTPLVAVSLLIWFVLAMQCMSTVAIVKRETGGWGWPIFMTVYMNGLAYVVCLVVFQVGTHVFHL